MKESQPKKYRYVPKEEAKMLADLGVNVIAEHPRFWMADPQHLSSYDIDGLLDDWAYCVEEE